MYIDRTISDGEAEKTMKIEAVHKIKKPLYITMLAAAIGTAAILGTSCGGSGDEERKETGTESRESVVPLEVDGVVVIY